MYSSPWRGVIAARRPGYVSKMFGVAFYGAGGFFLPTPDLEIAVDSLLTFAAVPNRSLLLLVTPSRDPSPIQKIADSLSRSAKCSRVCQPRLLKGDFPDSSLSSIRPHSFVVSWNLRSMRRFLTRGANRAARDSHVKLRAPPDSFIHSAMFALI